MKHKKGTKVLSFLLCLALMPCLLAAPTAKAADTLSAAPVVMEFSLNYEHPVYSAGRYVNWSGISSASQFIDEQGRFCFAADGEGYVTVFRTEHGEVVDTVSIPNPYDTFGGAVCDSSGNLYLVWGNNNEGEDTSLPTIYVCKYSPDGTLVATVSGNGSEGMPSYYGERFYTRAAFESGNCDIAINGDRLVVNYARHMYSGHQANTVFVVNLPTMTVARGITTYDSHSFDQRVSPYGRSGFLLESQGDCYPRAFSTSVTSASQTLNEMETFHFWVEEGAYDRYDMHQVNATRSRLGNILETSSGAALVASSARSLSENAKSEPYDVFVQVFDPMGTASSSSAYVTSGTRSGLSGKNGDENVTDYGVAWLTDFAGTGKSAEVVQAVSLDLDTVAVLYEQYFNGRYDSTWYLLLNGDGSVKRAAVNIGKVRLNVDEDPIYAQGAIQWVSNPSTATKQLQLNALFPAERTENLESEFLGWTANRMTDISEDAYYSKAVAWAVCNGLIEGTSPTTFNPNGACTRAQMVTLLWRCAGSPVVTGSNPFTDLEPGAYYYDAVLWAVKQGIVSGTSATTFSPNATVTRGQIVTLLYRANGSPAVSGGSFADVPANAYYADAVAWAMTESLTNGTSATTFSPNAICTRAQIVTLLYRSVQ